MDKTPVMKGILKILRELWMGFRTECIRGIGVYGYIHSLKGMGI